MWNIWNNTRVIICESKQLCLFSCKLSIARMNDTHHNLHLSPLKSITFWFRWLEIRWLRSLQSSAATNTHCISRQDHCEILFPVSSTNTSRGHSELPVRILTTGECTRNRLTLFGNVMVHCKRGIFLWGAIHQTSGLDVAWGAVIWLNPVTSLRPTLASGIATDRSDVYSGSVNILQCCFPWNHFILRPLYSLLIINSCQ